MNRYTLYFTVILLFSTTFCFSQFTMVTSSPLSSDGLESKGAAWIDYDNDGDDDLFVTISYSQNGVPSNDVLYQNNGDGTFTKISSSALSAEAGTGRNSTWADFNNDGLIDVFVANQLETFLFKNSGSGVFTKILTIPTTTLSFDSDHSGAAWGDFNADGYVDLYLASYKLTDNARNILYMNNKDESFTEISSGVTSAAGSGMDPAIIDYDNNGTLDIFVPNYCASNFLYSNQGNGTFTNATSNSLVPSNCSVGSSWADYDNDGDFDVLIENNVNQSNQFFENNGDGSFTFKFNALTTHSSSSAAWGDFNNDGFIDLVQVGSYPERKTYLYKNNGDKTFTDVSAEQGITNANYSWGVAWSDYDKDGFLDFFVANSFAESPFLPDDILYHNTPNANGWINIKLNGTKFNRSAIGANVKIKAGGKWQTRTIQAKTGNNSQNSLSVHFGLGTSEKIDTIFVAWPGYGYQYVLNQVKNKFIEITEANFPKAPTSLTATNPNLGEAKLSWIDNSTNETGFRIERSKGNTTNFIPLSSVLENVATYRDKGLEEGAVYYYRIASTFSGGFSIYSNIISVPIRKKQTITFQPIGTKTLDSAPFLLSATSTSNLATSFRVLEGNDKVALNGNQITILALGVSKLGAFQVGNDIYQPSDTVSQTLDVNLITGIEERDPAFLVYPNPVNEYLIILNRNVYEASAFKILNASGQTVYAGICTESKEVISFKDFTPGLYLLLIDNKRYKVIKR